MAVPFRLHHLWAAAIALGSQVLTFCGTKSRGRGTRCPPKAYGAERAACGAPAALPRRPPPRRFAVAALAGLPALMVGQPRLLGLLGMPGECAAARAADGGELTSQGMEAFRQGDVEESLQLFNAAAEAGYPRPLLWQRGISLYYAGHFEEGAAQFRQDVALNPNDTEESIWAMLCEARFLGFDEARKRMLVVQNDRRAVMRAAYTLFRGIDGGAAEEQLRTFLGNGGSDAFYAALYLGLLYEAKGLPEQARHYMLAASESPFGQASADYMAYVARVHGKLRGWQQPGASQVH